MYAGSAENFSENIRKKKWARSEERGSTPRSLKPRSPTASAQLPEPSRPQERAGYRRRSRLCTKNHPLNRHKRACAPTTATISHLG